VKFDGEARTSGILEIPQIAVGESECIATGTCSRSSDIIGRVNPDCGPRSVFRCRRYSFFFLFSFAPFLFLSPRRGTHSEVRHGGPIPVSLQHDYVADE